jgi:hypothetical protein
VEHETADLTPIAIPPRPPDTYQRALIELLLIDRFAAEELRAQAGKVKVVAHCGCG